MRNLTRVASGWPISRCLHHHRAAYFLRKMSEARSWHDNAIIVWRLVEDDTRRHGNAASSGPGLVKSEYSEAASLDMAWHEDNCRWLPLRSIIGLPVNPPFSRSPSPSQPSWCDLRLPRDRNAQFHSNRSCAYLLLLRASYQCWFNHLPCRWEWANRKNTFSIIRIPRDFLRFPLAGMFWRLRDSSNLGIIEYLTYELCWIVQHDDNGTTKIF